MQCLTNRVEIHAAKKSRETASDRHFNKNSHWKSSSLLISKKIPGFILNSLNDTGLNEFSGRKVVCLADVYFSPAA